MKKDYPRYTLRIPKSMLKKISHIADFYCRTTNKQIELLIKRQIDEHERCYGSIPISQENEKSEE